MTHSAPAKKKIAILGSGVAAMTTVFELTDPPGWQDKFEITVYQMGWRLGGKGASGRNLDAPYHYRIEEHGLHIWFGIYDNAFRLIRKCYEELGRAPDAPLGTWQAAFKPHSLSVLEENVSGQWLAWPIEMPTNTKTPGDGHLLMLITAALVAFTGYRMFDSAWKGSSEEHDEDDERPLRHRPLNFTLVGAVAGLLSGLLGIGGGVVMVPAFHTIAGMKVKNAIASSLVCVAGFAIPGTVTHAVLGNIDWRVAAALTVFVIPGARIGAALTVKADDIRLRLAIAGFLGIVSIIYAAGEVASL